MVTVGSDVYESFLTAITSASTSRKPSRGRLSPSSASLFNNSTLVPIRSYLTARTYSRLGALPSDLRLALLPLILAFASPWPFPYSESIVLTHLFSFRCYNVVSVSSTYRRGGGMAIREKHTRNVIQEENAVPNWSRGTICWQVMSCTERGYCAANRRA